jgi:ribosomal protein S13
MHLSEYSAHVNPLRLSLVSVGSYFGCRRARAGDANESLEQGKLMLRAQGKYLSEDEITNIKRLLAGTELTIQEIGTRVSCAKSTIVAINRKFAIRSYNGRRSEWVLNFDSRESGSQAN